MAKKTTVKKAATTVAANKAPAKKAATKKVAVKKTATKKAAVKKAAVKKAAPATKAVAKKAPAKKAAAKKAPAKKAQQTSIIARIDAGFGNHLFVRGEGAGLSWEKGTALENTSPYEWAFTSTDAKSNVTFKFLINDEIWADGENITIEAGSESISSPTFGE
jgi:hypothetical protein